MISRRKILTFILLIVVLSVFALFFNLPAFILKLRYEQIYKKRIRNLISDPILVNNLGRSSVNIVKNGTEEQNIKKLLRDCGGIENIIPNNAIVVVKPNAQWYNQGMTNTNSIKAFIDAVLSIEDFNGELIIADNHQAEIDDSRAWNTDIRNGDFNYNELIEHYKKRGFSNVTKYHWHCSGKCTYPLEGGSQGDSRINGPGEKDGYVWDDKTFYLSPTGRKCLMSYPIFTSSYSGITIDLKNGSWKNGKYLNIPVKFINFSALNHHGNYAGITASIKNLMGVVDMTCGAPGDGPKGTFNVHHIGVSSLKHFLYHILHWRIKKQIRNTWIWWNALEKAYENFHYTGGALGYFVRNIRQPDLNIISAERIGWGSRTDSEKAVNTKTVLAGTDPVALDYIAAKYVMYPVTPDTTTDKKGYKYKDLNNPENKNGPFYKFLKEAANEGVGNLDPLKIDLMEFDFKNDNNIS